MKSPALLYLGAAMLALPTLAGAQTTTPAASATPAPVKVTAGATVMDTKGGTVGTIDSVSGDLAVLNTGTNKVSLPLTSFGAGTSGPVIAMTKAEVDAAASGAAAKADAELAAMLVAGTAVSGPEGGSVGKIEAVEGDFVTIATAKNKVKLPKSAFAKGTTGVMVSMTAAQIDAAAAAANATPAKGS